MARSPALVPALADRIAALLLSGLPQDQATLDAVLASLGENDAAAALARLAADPETSEHAPLVALLLSPGPETRLALEPALAEAALDAAGAAELAKAVAERFTRRSAGAAGRVLALLPDGSRLELAATPEDLPAFVRRLRPQATAPAELRQILARRYGPQTALELAVLLRHCRLEWTPQRVFFLATLLERARSAADGLPGGDVSAEYVSADDVPVDDVPGLLAWATGFLDSFSLASGQVSGQVSGQTFDPRRTLAWRRQALLAQLRQAEFMEEALARGSYEVLMSQGLRLAHVHGPGVRAELEFLERAGVLVLGLRGAALDGVTSQDLGSAEDAEDLLRLLAGPED